MNDNAPPAKKNSLIKVSVTDWNQNDAGDAVMSDSSISMSQNSSFQPEGAIPIALQVPPRPTSPPEPDDAQDKDMSDPNKDEPNDLGVSLRRSSTIKISFSPKT